MGGREVYLGTQGWSYADWAGDMYDAGSSPASYLRAYAEEFDSVEIDSTFYGAPTPERVRRWCASVPEHFRFSLKMPREVTHDLRLVGAEELVRDFYRVVRGFGERLGCVLVQFGADFSRAEEPAFRAALEWIAPKVATAIEFRDPAWYEGDVQTMLAERGIALAVSDAPFVPREVMLRTLSSTATPFAYVRWIGRHDAFVRFDRVGLDRSAELRAWGEGIGSLGDAVRRVYGYVNNHYQGHAPATVRALYGLLHRERARPARVLQTRLFDL